MGFCESRNCCACPFLFLVAFSCVLRRDKLDGSESWSRFGSTPNLLRSLGTRPLGRVCMLVHDGFSAPNLLRNLGSRPSFAFAIAGTRCLVHYPNSRDSLPRPLPKQPGLVASSTTQTGGTRCLVHYPKQPGLVASSTTQTAGARCLVLCCSALPFPLCLENLQVGLSLCHPIQSFHQLFDQPIGRLQPNRETKRSTGDP